MDTDDDSAQSDPAPALASLHERQQRAAAAAAASAGRDAEMEKMRRVWEATRLELDRRRELLREVGEEAEERRRRADDDAALFERAAAEMRVKMAEHAEALRRARRRCRAYKQRLSDAAAAAEAAERGRDAAVEAAQLCRGEAGALRARVQQLSAEADRLTEQNRVLRDQDAARSGEASRETQRRARAEEEQRARVLGLDKLADSMRSQAAEHSAQIARLRRAAEDGEERRAALAEQLAAARVSAEQCRHLRSRVDELASESERLRQSNSRLLQLLQRDGEYGDLASDLAFVGAAPPAPAASSAAAADSIGVPKRESEYWMPAEVFRVASAYRREHFSGAAAQPFRDMLVQCGRVWRAREQRSVELAERRLRREHSKRARRPPAPVPSVAAASRHAAALRKDAERVRDGKGLVPAQQHWRAVESAASAIDGLVRRVAELEAAGCTAEASPGAGLRTAAAADDAASRVLALCADSVRCLSHAEGPTSAAAPALRAVLDIQRDFVARVQRELVELRAVVAAAPVYASAERRE